MIPDSDASLSIDVASDLQTIDSQSVDFREHRNRRIGHFDLDTRKKGLTALLPNLGLNETDHVLAAIPSLLNRIHQFCDQDERCCVEGIEGSGDAQALIDFIEYEKRMRKYFEENEFGG